MTDVETLSPSSPRPAGRLAVVTCMDARIDPLRHLGLGLGEAHVIRNAGGIVTDDALRSLALSQATLGTVRVHVVQHTGCALGAMSDDDARAAVAEAAGAAPPLPLHTFEDLEASVAAGVARVRSCPWLPERDDVRGFVLDLDTGALREVAGAAGERAAG